MKELTQKEKIEKAADLFDEIHALFPNNFMSLSIHGIDLKQLPQGFFVKKDVTPQGDVLIRGMRKENAFDITLFGYEE